MNESVNITQGAVQYSADTSAGGSFMPGIGYSNSGSGAPKTIQSEDIVFFEVSCSFFSLSGQGEYSSVYGYAAKVEKGVMAAFTGIKIGFNAQPVSVSEMALVDDTIMEDLQYIVKKNDYSGKNGCSTFVNGLPTNLGGSVNIGYASGEYISFGNNQSPVMGPDEGSEIANVIRKYIAEKRISCTNSKEIKAVTYREDWEDGRYSSYRLEATEWVSENKYGPDDKQYVKKELEVSEEAMAKIRQMVEAYSLLCWNNMKEFSAVPASLCRGRVIFTMNNGSEYILKESMQAPGPAKNIVFNIKSFLSFDLDQNSETGV